MQVDLRLGRKFQSWQRAWIKESSICLLKVWLEMEEEWGGGHRVYTRTETIMLQQHQSFLRTVISDRLPHPTPDQARQLHQALRRIRRGKRETGRTPEGNRCQRYPGFAYREERSGGGGTGFRERKINISLDFIVLISEMITQSAICSTEWHDIIKSCGKHCIQRTFAVIQPMAYISDITTVCCVGTGGSQDTETSIFFIFEKIKR